MTLEELCENIEHIEKYDAIIASEVIEHINDVDSFIGNIAKLLKVKKNKNFSNRFLNLYLSRMVFVLLQH